MERSEKREKVRRWGQRVEGSVRLLQDLAWSWDRSRLTFKKVPSGGCSPLSSWLNFLGCLIFIVQDNSPEFMVNIFHFICIKTWAVSCSLSDLIQVNSVWTESLNTTLRQCYYRNVLHFDSKDFSNTSSYHCRSFHYRILILCGVHNKTHKS